MILHSVDCLGFSVQITLYVLTNKISKTSSEFPVISFSLFKAVSIVFSFQSFSLLDCHESDVTNLIMSKMESTGRKSNEVPTIASTHHNGMIGAWI